MFGWEGDSLQRAMDSGCNLNQDCPAAGLTVQQSNAYNGCKIPQVAPEQVDGCKCLEVQSLSPKIHILNSTGLDVLPQDA